MAAYHVFPCQRTRIPFYYGYVFVFHSMGFPPPLAQFGYTAFFSGLLSSGIESLFPYLNPLPQGHLTLELPMDFRPLTVFHVFTAVFLTGDCLCLCRYLLWLQGASAVFCLFGSFDPSCSSCGPVAAILVVFVAGPRFITWGRPLVLESNPVSCTVGLITGVLMYL